MRKPFLIVGIALAALTGCGGDEGGPSGSSGTGSASPPSAPTPTPTPSPSSSSTPTPSPSSSPSPTPTSTTTPSPAGYTPLAQLEGNNQFDTACVRLPSGAFDEGLDYAIVFDATRTLALNRDDRSAIYTDTSTNAVFTFSAGNQLADITAPSLHFRKGAADLYSYSFGTYYAIALISEGGTALDDACVYGAVTKPDELSDALAFTQKLQGRVVAPSSLSFVAQASGNGFEVANLSWSANFDPSSHDTRIELQVIVREFDANHQTVRTFDGGTFVALLDGSGSKAAFSGIFQSQPNMQLSGQIAGSYFGPGGQEMGFAYYLKVTYADAAIDPQTQPITGYELWGTAGGQSN